MQSPSRWLRPAVILLASMAVLAAAPDVDVTLRGSPASMERQHQIAVAEEYAFVRTPAQLGGLADEGRLVPIPGGPDYELARVSYPFAVPEVRALLEYLAPRYREECGEALVVTSLLRPESGQPINAHALSVHPAGLAVDFRISRSPVCRKWFEAEVLTLERENALDATRESSPPHYHVAIFPEGLRARLASDSVGGPAAAGAAGTTGSARGSEEGNSPRWLWGALAALFTGAVAFLAYRILRSKSRGVQPEPRPKEGSGAGPGADPQPRHESPSTGSMV